MSGKIEKQTVLTLSLAALGIIYGDIGTSPLYAMHASLADLPINALDVFGVLSLIFWTLILIISIKYLCVVLRADNHGEGGILALLALLKKKRSHTINLFFIIAILGSGLMLGDGMLTPAISVMSAVEGLKIISPQFSQWILPISIVILLLLFLFQSSGTQTIGFLFGPIILIWFITIGVIGLIQIAHYPIVIDAINPYFAVNFLKLNGLHGYTLLGGVFLVVTGGEALYADLGHFGLSPIRYSWFLIVLPGLLLNYFGQGAYLLSNPEGITNPFYMMVPEYFLIPLILIATLATIIASQAVISATFSLTKQAVLLGLYPRLPIKQTSESMSGQIYVPQMNFILAIGTLTLVLFFKNSNSLAHAYGIAVNCLMILTTFMVMFVAYEKWHWSQTRILLFFIIFIGIDFIFLGANLQKLWYGGWLPILFSAAIAFIVYTWTKGMNHLKETFYAKKEDISELLVELHSQEMRRTDLTAILVTDVYDTSGGGFLRFLRLNHSMPENILMVAYQIENEPYISSADRYEIIPIGNNICQLILHYGFMDYISIPKALYAANEKNLFEFKINFNSAMYLIEVPNIVASRKKQTLAFYWQERLFSFLIRNYSANMNIEFYHLPYNKTIAIGTYCVI